MSQINPNIDEDIIKAASCLKALAHPIRLAIVRALQEGPLCVSDIEERVGSTQSNVSQHLAVLRDRGIISFEREKNQIYYFVDNWRIFQFVALARELFCGK